MDVLRRALEVSPPEASHAWWSATQAERERQLTTVDRAVIGGALVDRAGFAWWPPGLRNSRPHLALGGLLEQMTRLVTEVFARWPEGDERTRWHRDRKLLEIAGAARVARLACAREQLGLA